MTTRTQPDSTTSAYPRRWLALALLEQGAVALERAQLAGDAVETETLRRTDRSTLKAISGCASGDCSGGCSSAAPRTTPSSK